MTPCCGSATGTVPPLMPASSGGRPALRSTRHPPARLLPLCQPQLVALALALVAVLLHLQVAAASRKAGVAPPAAGIIKPEQRECCCCCRRCCHGTVKLIDASAEPMHSKDSDEEFCWYSSS